MQKAKKGTFIHTFHFFCEFKFNFIPWHEYVVFMINRNQIQVVQYPSENNILPPDKHKSHVPSFRETKPKNKSNNRQN